MSKVVKIKSQLKKEKNNLLLGVALTFILSLVFSASGLSLLLAIMLQKSALHISIPVIFIVSAFLGFVFFINIKKKYGNRIRITAIFDKEMITPYKSSPIDQGRRTFEYLLENRIKDF